MSEYVTMLIEIPTLKSDDFAIVDEIFEFAQSHDLGGVSSFVKYSIIEIEIEDVPMEDFDFLVDELFSKFPEIDDISIKYDH
jgi:hypothetical protein